MLVDGDKLIVAEAELVNETAVNLRKLFLVKSQALGDFFREIEANVANCLALEDLLGLVEFFAHEFVKVVCEDKILKLCQLH